MGVSSFEVAGTTAVDHLQAVHPLALWLLTEVDADRQRVVAAAGPWAGRFPRGAQLPWLGSMALVMVAGGPTAVPDVSVVPGYRHATAEPRAGVHGYVGVALTRAWSDHGADDLLGCLSGFSAVRDDPAVPAAASSAVAMAQLLSVVAGSGRDTERRVLALTEAARYSLTDPLTGLGSRRAWDAALRDGADDPVAAGVLAVDLDGLKHLNDTRGHAAGDDHLRTAAGVLRSACRPEDLVARPGGDEFAVLVHGSGPTQLHRLAERLRHHLDRAHVPASLGAAAREPGEDLLATWTRADLAMYADKRSRQALRGGARSPDRA